VIVLGHTLEHLRLTLRSKYWRVAFSFHVTDLLRNASALVQQRNQLRIDRINLIAQRLQLIVTHLALIAFMFLVGPSRETFLKAQLEGASSAP
jgi:hypothetical protein